MKRKVFVLLLCAAISINGTIPIGANEATTDSETFFDEPDSVPEQMLPNTVIKYVSEDEYVILQGGELNSEEENNSVYEWARTDLLKKEKIDIDNLDFVKCETITPSKGMVVKYAKDGRISSISSMNLSVNAKAKASRCSRCGEKFLTGSAEPFSNFMWGGNHHNNNILYAGEKVIYGYGRFTTFSDSMGQANHKLKKGDVATRGHVDNPKAGTYITCEAPVKGTGKRMKVKMQKWDIGCMPDAVLDIWKTGVEKWGYKWNSSLSISDGYYEYER